MAFTRRAQRRLTILVVLTVLIVIVGSVAWIGRQIIRNRGAETARVDGLALLEQGDYENALPHLSTAVSRNKKNVELLVGFAKARSRVPIKKGKHLLSSIALYRRALNVEPNNLEALNGLLEMQFRAGMITQLVATANKIRELDPSDTTPIHALKQAAIVRGRFGPTSVTSGTNEDDSALRWVDELIVLEPESTQNRTDRLVLMEQLGRSQSEILSIAETWADESEMSDGRLDVVLAQTYLIHDLPDESIKAITEAVDKGIDEPRALLLAIGILDTLNNIELKEFVSQQAEERALNDPVLARAMITLPWQQGDLSRVANRIEKYTDVLSNTPNDLLFLAQVYSVLEEYDQAKDILQQIRDREWDQEAITDYEDQITSWERFVNVASVLDQSDLSQEEYISQINIAEEELETTYQKQFANYIIGLMFQRADLSGLASSYFRKAVDSSGVLHVLPGQLLIENLLQQGRALDALPISELLVFRHSQSLVAFIEWVRVRAALDRMGLSASQHGARIRPYENSYDLAKSLFENSSNDPQMKTLLIEAALAVNSTDDAIEIFSNALNEDEFSASNIVFLAQNFMGIEEIDTVVGLLDLMLEKLNEQEGNQDAIDAIIVFKTLKLRQNGLIDEAEAIAQDHFSGRNDQKSQQIIMLEKLENYKALNVEELPDWVTELIDSGIGYRSLKQLMTTAINSGNFEVALQIKQRVDSLFGRNSQPALLMEADLILSFPDMEELQEEPFHGMSSLVGLIGLQLDREPNSPDLVFRQFRLLDMLDPNDQGQSTDLLIEMVNARPDAIEFYPPLISHLQELGRFREADQYISRFEKQKLVVSPTLRRVVDQLRLGQGDPDEALKAMRRSAEAPNATVEEKIAYVELALIIGENANAMVVLDELMQDQDRPVGVDRQFALVQLRNNDIDGAVNTLREAPGFSDSETRTLYISNLYLSQRNPKAALEELMSSPEILSTSYLANNLAGQSYLALDDVDTASSHFEKALVLGNDSESAQLSILGVMIEEPVLRAKAIPRLEAILKTTKDPGTVEIMLIGALAAGSGGLFNPTDQHLDQSLALTNQYPGNQLGWGLAMNLHLAAINNLELEMRSITSGSNKVDLEQLTALHARHLDLIANTNVFLRDASNRFEADASYTRSLSLINYGLSEYEEALRFANVSQQRSPGDILIDSLLQGQALVSLGRYSNAAKVLRKHKQEIIELSRNLPLESAAPKEFDLLIEALLKSGEIDEAREVLEDAGTTPKQLVVWQTQSTDLKIDNAIKALQILDDKLPQTSFNDLRLMQSWTLVARKIEQNDVALQMAHEYHQKIEESNSRIEGLQLEDLWFKAQVELSLAGLQEITSLIDARDTYRNVVEMVPSNIRDSLQRFSRASPEEGQLLLQWVNVLVTALNNEAALSAKLNSDLANALIAVNEALKIIPNNPDILDTRAMLYVAAGRGSEAVADALAATKIMPNRLDFKLTLAEGYALEGNVPVALELISEVERLNIIQIEPDDSIRTKATKIRESLVQRQAG